jgi:kynurenine formamidase
MPEWFTDAELDAVYERSKNWGRWGNDDERGTLNLLTPERVRAAASLVTEGLSVSLAHDLATSVTPENPRPVEHRMLAHGEQRQSSGIPGYEACRDYVGTDIHGVGITHIDALSHMFVAGQMYNGLDPSMVSELGALRNSIMPLATGVVGRGVLLDVPSSRGVPYLELDDVVTVDDLLAAERAQGVLVGEGDIALISTGRDAMRARRGQPHSPHSDGVAGLHPECIGWIHDRGVAVLGSDGISDCLPLAQSDRWPFPVHQIGITAMGLYLVDSMRLDELALRCADLARWSFMVTIAVLRIPGGTGCPVNPIAVF